MTLAVAIKHTIKHARNLPLSPAQTIVALYYRVSVQERAKLLVAYPTVATSLSVVQGTDQNERYPP